jgi:ubiquinone biosynthesis protein COQ4
VKKIWNLLRLLAAVRRLIRNNQDIAAVFDIGEAAVRANPDQLMTRMLSRNPHGRAMIQARKEFVVPPLRFLATLPEGSLGKEYSLFMLSQGLDPEYYRRPSRVSDASYILLHLRQTHDVWHVVTGYDTSAIGEVQIQSFMLAQVFSPVSMVLVGVGIFSGILTKRDSFGSMLEAIVKAWLRGNTAYPLFGYDFANHWDRPLAEVRIELNLTRAS